MLLAATVILSGCGRTTIDLKDYLEYEFTGANGYGRVSSSIHRDNIVDDHPEAFEIDGDDDAALLGGLSAYLEVEDLGGSWDKDEDLSNGDSIVFTWDKDAISAIEEEYKVKLKGNDIKVTVEGLKDVEQYDAFEDLEVSFEGYAPKGEVSLNSEKCGIDSLEYTADPSDHLNNGDKVTVTVTVPEDCAKQYGKVPKETSKEYTVSGLDGYVTSASEIPEETMNAMKKQAEDTRKAKFAQTASEKEKMTGMTYVGNYFLTLKDGAETGWYNTHNKLYLIYKTDFEADGGTVSGYWFCKFSDIKVLADGTCSVNTTSYDTPSRWDSEIRIANRYSYIGYPDITSLFNQCVTENVESYDYEDNVGNGDGKAQPETEAETTEGSGETA